MPGLRIKSLELARSAAHPEQNACFPRLSQSRRVGGQQVLPAQHAGSRCSGGNRLQKVAAANMAATDRDGRFEVKSVGHGCPFKAATTGRGFGRLEACTTMIGAKTLRY